MQENSSGEVTPIRPQSDLIIPPTMVSGGKSKQGKVETAEAPEPVGPVAYVFLIFLTLLTFAPILLSDVLWTSYDQVERAPSISMENWTDAWAGEVIKRYDPITLTSYYLEKKLPAGEAMAHRVINLLLHLTATLLLLRILQSLKLRGAYAAALVFAIHPSVLQTLFWPGYRNELIGLVFILASLFYGIRNRDSKDYTLALLLSTASMLLHPAALVLPLLMGLAIFFQNKSFHLHHYNRVLPIACLALFGMVWTQPGNPQSPEIEEINTYTLVGQNMFFYLKQSFLPVELQLFHPYSRGQTYSVGAANSLLAYLVFAPFLVLVAFNFRKRWARGILLGVGSFILLLLHGITHTGRFIDGSLAKEDHALYVALPIVAAFTFCGAAGIFQRKKGVGSLLWKAVFSIFLLIQLMLTLSYSLSVSDPNKMWQTLADQWPDSWQPKAALIESVRATDSDLLGQSEMIRTLEEILKNNPNRHRERLYLARSYQESGQNTNALREYRYILRETQPENEILEEAAKLMDNLGLSWEANNARDRIEKP